MADVDGFTIGDHMELVYRGPIRGIRHGDELTLVQIGTRWHQLNEPQEIYVNGEQL